jgi:Tfp pilus assembly protein PilX
MRALRSEQGIALVAAVLLMSVMAGLGLALLLFTNNQQKASAREQANESAFDVAEAALNAQVGQLSRSWPAASGEALPDEPTNGTVRCIATTTTAMNGCPDAGSLSASYPSSSATCPAGTPKDRWGSATSNEWTTYVRDDTEGTGALFNSTSEQSAAGWDANGDNKLWVRSVGVVGCRMVVLLTLVSRQLIALNFPRSALTANWFETSNQGNHSGPIVNLQGGASEPAPVSMRCEELGGKTCENYQPGQVEPTPGTNEPSPSTTLGESQLEALKQQAKAAGAYYATGSCPAGVPAGLPAYVEGPCAVEGSGNTEVNKGSPGFLVILNGTLKMKGSSVFYGVVYAANKQGSKEAVVTTEGNAKIIGAIDVDGNGGIKIGASGNNTNFTYDPTALNEIKSYAGAAATRNSFRILSNSE